MMTLSPNEARLVDWVISRQGSSQLKELWSHTQSSRIVSREMVAELLSLLQRFESQIRTMIDSGNCPEDREADLANDLGIVLALEDDLRREAA